MEQLGSHWTDFHEFLYEYFSKIVEKIQGTLKSDNNNDTLHEDLCTFIIFRSFFLRMRNISDRSCRENQNTHLCSITFCENEIMWENMLERTGHR
jgi:hypothetical protein